ncbi:hypothetical protein Tb927.6.4110 [Trypanosoma brucei brucei TREU927]|uniref:T. brucei spp.-specific protein n=1 Tax=Trypanosoma brucei brucei (strain 927/4 GUTat10.1) TaxID=185431 RepID=Q586A9_TRYB2|nr:hypothetical protein Tb927.6.4110 [Trypanosoma brucei brucei TREU927]AAX80742.1 hypothetical protein Tb927.6.4110 [Trypanosoma brucei]AAZ11970.1 hypothetical protein Tb927.6.4110 [Trypanosoma brucei brucei TREU927]
MFIYSYVCVLAYVFVLAFTWWGGGERMVSNSVPALGDVLFSFYISCFPLSFAPHNKKGNCDDRCGKGKAEYAPGILGWYCDYQYRRFFWPCVSFICRVCHRLRLSLGSLLRLLYFIYSFFYHLVVVCVCCQAGAANTVHAKGEKGLYSPWKQRALRREDFGCRNGAETHRITHKQTNYKYRLSQ